MKIGVSGASGHVGNVVCRLLIEQGHTVKAMYKSDKRALEDVSVELVQGDVLNEDDVRQFVEGCDYIIHSAAIISIYGDPTGIVFKTNTEGPANILKASIASGVKKIIHISSSHAVMEPPLDEPLDESRAYKQKQHFAYDYSKSTGEQLMLKAFREGKIEGCVIRPSSVVGVFDFKPSEMGKALLDFYHRKIPMLPPGGYNFVDVRDVASTIISAIDKGRNGEVYFACGKYHSIKHVAEKVKEITGVKTPKSVMPFWFMRGILPFIKLYSKVVKAAPLFTIEAITALKLGHPDMRSDKAQKELGHSYRSLDIILSDFYKWHDEQGNLKRK